MPRSTTRRVFVQESAALLGLGLCLRTTSARGECAPVSCDRCARPCEAACPDGIRIAATLAGDPTVPERRRRSVYCGECNLCAEHCPAGLPVVELLLNR